MVKEKGKDEEIDELKKQIPTKAPNILVIISYSIQAFIFFAKVIVELLFQDAMDAYEQAKVNASNFEAMFMSKDCVF